MEALHLGQDDGVGIEATPGGHLRLDCVEPTCDVGVVDDASGDVELAGVLGVDHAYSERGVTVT